MHGKAPPVPCMARGHTRGCDEAGGGPTCAVQCLAGHARACDMVPEGLLQPALQLQVTYIGISHLAIRGIHLHLQSTQPVFGPYKQDSILWGSAHLLSRV